MKSGKSRGRHGFRQGQQSRGRPDLGAMRWAFRQTAAGQPCGLHSPRGAPPTGSQGRTRPDSASSSFTARGNDLGQGSLPAERLWWAAIQALEVPGFSRFSGL